MGNVGLLALAWVLAVRAQYEEEHEGGARVEGRVLEGEEGRH